MTALLFAGFALAALATPAMATQPCPDEDTSDACNNSGTVKVHTINDLGSPSNDPHVDCPFYVEGFNMNASSGTLVIKAWPPTGDKTVVVNDTWAMDDPDQDNHHFLNGPYTLPTGHYKLSVSDTLNDKHKVFWVDCEQTTTTGTTTGTTTEIPFFPSTTALVVGIGGAALGSLFMLRRRL
ncbi:MAG TPA: hypothetical protein VM241_04530 [Candidatus Thermoplasmatota archaeon]|nr:hypothetical protein [Candidatus Thermoplasmatota archaeon]